MPTYEYECGACGRTFEFFQSMTEAPKRKCPECGRIKLRRIISSGGGVIFKGSGFYETDYKRSSAGKQGSSKTKKTESPSSSGGSGKESSSSSSSGGGKEAAG